MGLLKAGLGAAGGVMADQWKEYIYCESMPADVLACKGSKRTGGRSSNTRGEDNVISNGSVIAVADGQCMIIVEDGASIRAVKRVYGELTGNPDHGLEPKDLAEVCEGKRPGDKEAAIKAFDKMGEVAGDAMATAVTLIDGLIVIGGGVMNNHKYLMPGILRTMRGKMHQLNGDELNRVQMKVYNLDDPAEFEQFARGEARSLKVYGSDREVVYDPQKRVGVMRSKIGASKAISLGAYAFALTELDK